MRERVQRGAGGSSRGTGFGNGAGRYCTVDGVGECTGGVATGPEGRETAEQSKAELAVGQRERMQRGQQQESITTPNLETLGNEDLVEDLSNHGVTSQKYLNMDDYKNR